MTSGTTLWTYALAPDVEVCPADGGAFIHTATCQIWLEATELKLLELLAAPDGSDTDIYDRFDQPVESDLDGDHKKRCAALLFRLDRLGLLTRGLSSRGRRLVSCIPLRPPPRAAPKCALEGPLRLSPRALARVEQEAISLETPGSWAKMLLHDRSLLPLLYDLATGLPAAEITKAAAGHSEQTILAILGLMDQCELFNSSEQYGWWSSHDLFFHTRTRRGYARAPLGKSALEGSTDHQSKTTAIANDERRLVLELPILTSLFATDPPYALVSARRQSVRRQGSLSLTSRQLSEFLFRTVCEQGGRRPYPSGGACYPLQTYLAVNRCRGVAPGLYAYDPTSHELIAVGGPGPKLARLLADAAGTANVDEPPQILLVFAADYRRMRRLYADLSYSLILKEVGAVFQLSMMAAAAMGLGACPLGCGDTRLFSELIGVDPMIESSVGELMLGSLE
jgi:oxazoline/thiazoline dehydrogenase